MPTTATRLAFSEVRRPALDADQSVAPVSLDEVAVAVPLSRNGVEVTLPLSRNGVEGTLPLSRNGVEGTPLSSLDEVRVALPSLVGVESVSDAALTTLVERYGEAKRMVEAGLARLSGEAARRSTVELGYAGLAQRTGDRTPEAFVARLTGTTAPEAKSLVEVGSMLTQPAPWLTGVVSGVEAGTVSVATAGAIKKGLGTPSASVAADDLLDAAETLLAEATDHTPEHIGTLARDLRDGLDAACVADREAARRARRFLKLTPLPDGMTRITGLLDPESAAIVKAALDPLTSPRRGGPRFVDADDQARAQAIADDPRTIGQLTHDGFVELVRIGSHADDGRLYGSKKPAVHLNVTLADLDARRLAGVDTGYAHPYGETANLSLATAERMICAGGYLPVLFDDNLNAINHGRTHRLFTTAQKTILAIIWGGCAVDGCTRPPSWCEAHHVDHFVRDHGDTNVDRGILLCRHHHLMIHNNGWTITTPGHPSEGGWVMHPPPGDPTTKPIRLISKNPLRTQTQTRN
jgi:hypothetical protein